MSLLSTPLVCRSITYDNLDQTLYIRQDIGVHSCPLTMRAANIIIFPGITVWGTSITLNCAEKFINLGHIDSFSLKIIAREHYIGGTKRAKDEKTNLIVQGDKDPVYGNIPAIEALNKVAGETLFRNSQDNCPSA